MVPSARGFRSSGVRGFATALLALASGASAQVLPPPSYDQNVYAFFYHDDVRGPDAAFNAAADALQAALTPGPYVELGFADYLPIDMVWNYNLKAPALSSPDVVSLGAVLSRLHARGLRLHLSVVGGTSRLPSMYAAARIEDRRGIQWYRDGSLATPAQLAEPGGLDNHSYMTPSRYARKLRRHLQTKVSLAATLLADLRAAYPETLVSVSGDAEFELNPEASNAALPEDQQLITDYSPFAILEFRDWIQHAGLYAPAGPYTGEGFSGGGAIYQGPAGLAQFNTDYGTAFGSWNLAYFDWSLGDPIDGDPKAIPLSTYSGGGWSPLPSSGPDFLAGGFDAPRAANTPSAAFWSLWKTFRVALVANYVRDFAGWFLSAPSTLGPPFPPERFYTHQIPADYLYGSFPGSPNTSLRLHTSASPMSTALAPPPASVGVTSFDLLFPTGYERTSQHLVPALTALSLPNWGFPEYSPAWPAGMPPESNVPLLASKIQEMADAGAHILCFSPWAHFVGQPMVQGWATFIAQQKYRPRFSSNVTYVPPKVTGLAGAAGGSTLSFTWSPAIFSTVPGLAWTDWPSFDRFELWRGASAAFTTADGEWVKNASAPSATGVAPVAGKPYFKVLAVNANGDQGALSDGVFLDGTAGSAFHTVAPCRVLDTRGPNGPFGGPPLAPSAIRAFTVAGTCGIPASARSASVNVTIVTPSGPGNLRFFPGDAQAPLASTINFLAGQVRANNAILPLSAAGAIRVQNDMPAGTVHLVVDVNGYFQ